MRELNPIEKGVLTEVLQDACSSDDFNVYREIIENITNKLNLEL